MAMEVLFDTRAITLEKTIQGRLSMSMHTVESQTKGILLVLLDFKYKNQMGNLLPSSV